MTNVYYKLPPELSADIDAYEKDVRSFIDGKLPPGVMKAKRVPRGVYEQRQDGTYMLRVRVAGGTLKHEQATTLSALATGYGNGMLHVTTRQDVQLHDLAIEDTPVIMRWLMNVGLTSKGGGGNTVRNITSCPYAGICPHECFDVTPLAHAVTEYLIQLVGSYNLPRKYKIAFSGCAADCALAQVTDLGFIAEIRNGEPGFRVTAGGGMGAHSRAADEMLAWMPASEVIRSAEAVRRLFDELGDRNNRQRARLRFVFERLGADLFRDRFLRMKSVVAREGVPEWDGECELKVGPAKEKGGVPGFEIVDGVRCLPQRQEGFFAVPLHLPLGFVSADDFAKIVEAARNFSEEDGLRTTRSQNLLVRFVNRCNLVAMADELRKLSTDVLSRAPLGRFVACAGASTCRLGLCLARGAAHACARRLESATICTDTLDNIEIHINGCPNACGQQPIGQIGFFGAAQRVDGRLVPSYRITLGGRCNADGARFGVPVGQVPAKAAPAFLSELSADFQGGRRDGESFPSYFDRLGPGHFERLVARHSEVPSYDDRPEFYRDFGVEEDFSLAGRGAGECGAGVFEVIQEDLTAAEKADKPFDKLLHATRALLIARGVDANDPDSVLRAFETHFVDSGLVSEEFRALIGRARGFTQGWRQALDGQDEAVTGLLDRVRELYASLDANLQFNLTAGTLPDIGADQNARTTDAPSEAAARDLDLRGVACPMNFVKARLRLEMMDIGDTLSIILDDGEPARNVPASFRNEGQKIEETTDLGDGHWRVVVRKMQ